MSWLDLCMSEIRLARTSSENDVWYSPRYIYAYVIYICACSANIWVTISVVFCLLWNLNWRNIGKLVFNNLKDLVNIYIPLYGALYWSKIIYQISVHIIIPVSQSLYFWCGCLLCVLVSFQLCYVFVNRAEEKIVWNFKWKFRFRERRYIKIY